MLSQTTRRHAREADEEHRRDAGAPLRGEHLEEAELVEPEDVGVEAGEDEERDDEGGDDGGGDREGGARAAAGGGCCGTSAWLWTRPDPRRFEAWECRRQDAGQVASSGGVAAVGDGLHGRRGTRRASRRRTPESVGDVADDLVAVRRRARGTSRPRRPGAVQLLADPADRPDLAVRRDRARCRRCARRRSARPGVSLSMIAEREHHAGARAADVVELDGDVEREVVARARRRCRRSGRCRRPARPRRELDRLLLVVADDPEVDVEPIGCSCSAVVSSVTPSIGSPSTVMICRPARARRRPGTPRAWADDDDAGVVDAELAERGGDGLLLRVGHVGRALLRRCSSVCRSG